ncbi:non-ribosomal peptide synthetase [Nostoc sp. UIC 10630]|uniref:non-ribosomal peptide synthetase n=1 Tax=Nostoc sp. UIC 10630 TaxID=2100146 RepID=UPI0013CFB592|nr:non-ribosomal peptide synthetase [Nostoc sp. UIC 10630]NEU79519.1 amino acid adenylation domain-containing protein [Nostoc sp. UIC 10630]QID92163.1 nonribosomal peptide synthetase [Nostoc sp. UIC 10630]
MTNSIIEFLDRLSNLNINLEANGDRLRCHAPEGVLTPTLLQEITGRKTEIMLFLQQAKQVKTSHQLPIQRVPRDGELPLSFAQQRLWFLHQLSPDSRSYNMLLILRLDGSLNIVALEQSLGELICRHEVLRTTFPTVDGKPVQRIAPPTALTLPVYDLQALSAKEQTDRIRQMANSQASQPFDLAVGPLIQFTLLQLNTQEYVLLLKMHHIIYDGWSLNIFFGELSIAYAAFIQGLPNPLAQLPIQYADFAFWQRQWLTGEVLERQLNYWQQQLAGAPGVLELPTDKPRPPVQTFRGGVKRFRLDRDLTQRLKQLSQKSDATLFMTLLAAFLVLLCRYSGQSDIVVGSPIANRNNKSLEQLMGFFANTLALRGDLSGNPSFADFLAQVRQTTLSAYAHQDLPFEMLVEKLQPERDLSRNPLVQVMFALQNTSLSFGDLPGLIIQNMSLPVDEMVKFDLEVNYWEDSSGLEGVWSYSADLFDAATITRIVQNFQTLLQAIVANPKARILELPLLTTTERHQLLVEWNNTQVDYSHDQCIHHLFESQAERIPHAVAVVYENEQLTYHELNCRANQLAHYLRSLGVGPEVLVGICVKRSPEMVVGLLGILKAGGAYVPLDPDYPQERLSFMLEDAQVSVLLTQQRLVDKLSQHQANLVCLDEIWSQIIQNNQDNPVSEVRAFHIANVIYTSGSTGRPKGVMVEHTGLCNLAQAQIQTFGLQNSSRILQFASLSFDASIWEFVMALGSGATLYLGTKDSLLPGIPLIEQLRNHCITHITLPPSALAVMPVEKLPALQTMIVAGEACSAELIRQWSAGRNFFNAYGPTEATVCATIAKCTDGDEKISIGRAIANTQVYILDENLQLVPIGVPGELHIGGVGLARGYLNRPELTTEKFIPNPFYNSKSRRVASEATQSQNSKLYKTGDLARYLPDGNIEYLGRIDNQIKIRGFRIELGEIEAILSQNGDVQASCVIVRKDTPGEQRLVAYIVPQNQSAPTISELRQFLKTKLPNYMVPSTIVILESLPLTPNGKVDRRALPAPELDRELLDKYIAPRTPIEEMLAHIWADVLKVEQVGIHDNFFEIGGHSLLATQVISRIHTTFKIELLLRSLFTAATVAQLAREIQQWQQQQLELTVPPLLPTPRNAHLPLSFAQSRLWFLDQLKPNSAFYNIPGALRLQGQLQVTALEQSLCEIIHRHEALRTNFVTVDGQPTQIIHPETAWTLSIVDWQYLPTSEQEIAAQQLAIAQAQQPFDLANEPLFRATLVVLSDTEHILLVCMHHIVSDGWSMGVFVQELAALYDAYSQGQPLPLAPLPVQYADFAVWQRQWLQGDVLQTQMAYWQQQLADAPGLLSLPTDRPRPTEQTFSGAHLKFELSVELTAALTQLSQQQGVTLFMTLLAAFDVLLYRYTGQSDILVGSPIANRNHNEIEGLIGFFVNTLVMRTDVSGNPNFGELLGRVRNMAIDAYAHQDLPFEMLVEALQPERNLSHTPLFQVMFVFQNAPMPEVELAGLTVSLLPAESATAKFDITLSMENTASGLVGVWEYNTDLFDSSTISRMAGHFQTLLSGIVANPIEPISQLPLLSEVEQQQLLVEWNDTTVKYPTDKCIHHLFESQAERIPHAVALVYENEQLTYHELNCRANQLAHYLRSLGVGPEVLVGICVKRSPEMVVGLLGILKAGGAYVPLDPDYPQERLSFMLEDAQVSVLLTQQRLVDKLSQHQANLVCLDEIWSQIIQNNQDNPVSEVRAFHIANVIYTSGSTGRPKGVMVEHTGLCNLAQAQIQTFGLQNSSRILQFASLSFDASIWEFVMALGSGATLYLGTKDSLLPGIPLIEQLRNHCITHITLPPSALAVMPVEKLPALQTMIVAGEACSAELIRQWSAGRNFFNAYGPTEATVCATIAKCTDGDEKISIGRAIANTQVYILDENLQLVPIGVPGELHIGGVGLARGYLNRPELTTEKFIPNPFYNSKSRRVASEATQSQNSKLYKTGDLARYLPDGNIEYLGRIDNQVKIRGFRIELREIEVVLSQHPSVHSVVVTARVDTSGDQRLIAYIVPQQHTAPTISELRQFLKTKLPNYMVPSAFVMLESLPLTPNGKVDRKALPAPDFQQALLATYVAPQTELEQTIARVWQQVLHREKVGIYDNFFDLGGHSLLIAQVHNQLQQLLPKKVLMVELFQYPTINSLANYLTQSPSENTAFKQSHQQVNQQKEAINRHKQRRQRQEQK